MNKLFLNNLLRPVRHNERGIAHLTLTLLIVGVTFGLIIYEVLNLSLSMINQSIYVETRQKVFDQEVSMLQDPDYLSYTLSSYLTAQQSSQLKKCILAGAQQDPSCQSVSMTFYYPTANGAAKFLGTSDNPIAIDKFGNSCNPNAQQCPFNVNASCQFFCPAGETACGMVKVMACDLKVVPATGLVLRSFSYLQQTQTFAAAYSIRLNNNLTQFTAIPTYYSVPCYMQSVVPAGCNGP